MRARLAVVLKAIPEGIHQIDHVARFVFWLYNFDLLSGSLAPHELAQRLLISVLELVWIEVARLCLEDVLGQAHHVFRNVRARHTLEVFFLLAHLVIVAQRCT